MSITEFANVINTQSSLKYILCACIAGAANKLYDDIEDNVILASLKTVHNMEILKGIHYITFTVLSVTYPLFFVISYIGVFINKYISPSSYALPYENALLYSFGWLFLFLDYSKINAITTDEYYFITISFLGLLIEEVYDYISKRLNKTDTNVRLLTEEVSHKKLLFRIILIIAIVITILKHDLPPNIKYLLFYFFAYFVVSCCIQFYSIYIYKPPQPIEVPPIIQEKKEENVEQTEVKEGPDLPIITSVSQV